MPPIPVPEKKPPALPPGARFSWGVVSLNVLAAGVILALILGAAFTPGPGQTPPALAARPARAPITSLPAARQPAQAILPASPALPAGNSISLAAATPTPGSSPAPLRSPAVAVSPAPALTPVAPQPGVPQQGGNCIDGYLIDTHEQRIGGGWKVTALSEDGQSETGETDASSNFRLPAGLAQTLAGGGWRVTLEDRDGWQPFTPDTFNVTLSGDAKAGCAHVRFKEQRLACLVVTKYDKSGQLGLPEMVGIPDWKMTLSLGNTVFEQTTDGQGRAYFPALPPGQWTLEEEAKIGWRRSNWPLRAGETPAPGRPNAKLITLASPPQGAGCQETEFVNEQVNDGCLIARLNDVYGNPLGGWTFTVHRDDGTQADMVRKTDTNGEALFMPMALGQWTVAESPQKWWRPQGTTVRPVEIKDPGFCPVMDFLSEPLGGVDGYKINHLEQGLPGWKITATSASTGEVISATTDSTGYFAMILPLGTWTVAEAVQDGWVAVTASHFMLNVSQPFTYQHVRFKNRATSACIDIFKRDAFDKSGLPGWTISLKPKYGGQAVQDVTDGTGWVRFSGLAPGWYVAEEHMLAGWAPNGPARVEIEAKAYGAACATYTFWNHQDNGQAAAAPVATSPVIPASPVPMPTPAVCRAWYYVQPGDTLARIARAYGVSAEVIKSANRLPTDRIAPGQKLCIP